MKFGYFDDSAREYVITTPKTPLPWINYLGTNEFFSLISNTCGGYSFYKDAKLLRLTRYRYNNVPMDNDGRYFYIKDGDTVYTGAEDESTTHTALWRSDGTVDQLYLALRLAVAEELTPDAPLVLDDALVRFDDDRLRRALEVLGQAAETKQVLLFTCQKREAALLSESEAAL